MIESGHVGTIRFVGGHHDGPAFDLECRLVSVLPGGIELRTNTDPEVTIRLSPRYIGKVIGRAESETTSTVCTYTTDAGDEGMAAWVEDEAGKVEVRAGDY